MSTDTKCSCGGDPHTMECYYEHFLNYTDQKDSPAIRQAYFHGAELSHVKKLEVVKATLEVASNKTAELHKMSLVSILFIAEQIARIDPEEILNILGELK